MLARMQCPTTQAYQPTLKSRFSDSTIASTSSSFSCISYGSSVSSVEEDHLLPAFDMIPKPPPRSSSITAKSTRSLPPQQRKKPSPLSIPPYQPPSGVMAVAEDDEEIEDYFNCKDFQQRRQEQARNKQMSLSLSPRRCFCGNLLVRSNSRRNTMADNSTPSGIEIYCSRECARQDALYALEGGSPSSVVSGYALDADAAEVEDDFPVTPTNNYFPSPPRTPECKARAERNPLLPEQIASLGASHYRRMEALGLYDSMDQSPTKHRSKQAPVDLIVATSPTKSSRHYKFPLHNNEADLDFDPRKTLFFPVPIYMGSAI